MSRCLPDENALLTNLLLLASYYLQNNQSYWTYHILKGTHMVQSRYLFALSCFQMDLLNEVEVALCPPIDFSTEVPNGAAGHYLLGFIYSFSSRREKRSSDHYISNYWCYSVFSGSYSCMIWTKAPGSNCP